MKKTQLFLLLFIFGFVFLIPFNTNAEDRKLVSCSYSFTNSDGKDIELDYEVRSDGSVVLPFSAGTKYVGDSKDWYHSYEFESAFYNASVTSDGSITCPSIYIQESDLGVTIYPNPMYQESCTGNCYTINANSTILSKWARNNDYEKKEVVSTCSGSSIAFYNRKSYVFPTFRLYSDGTREWSIDGEIFVSVNDSISGSINSDEKFTMSLNKSLINSVFKDNGVSCPGTIYRCVSESDNGYSYELSTARNRCSNDTLGNQDGQAQGSLYYNAAFGEPNGEEAIRDAAEDIVDSAIDFGGGVKDIIDFDENDYDNIDECDAILGSTQDEESVAWLLQQVLNYIRILGPILVVILSSMDFAKSIMANDDDSMKKVQKKLMIRLILAVALFLVPTLVTVLLNIFGITTNETCGLQ